MPNDTPPSVASPQTASNDSVSTLNLSENSTADWAISAGYLQQQKSGARWFYWIAALSLINSLIVHFKGSWGFLAGLSVTQFTSELANVMAEDLGTGVVVVAIGFEILIAAICAGFGFFAEKGHSWAFIVGGILYLIDGLIFLLVGAWLSLAFHAYVLYCIYKGFSAHQDYRRLQSEGMA